AILHHVEIKTNATALELRRIHRPHARLDADPFQTADESEREALLVAGRGENFERERPAGGDAGQLRPFEFIAGGLEQCEGAAEGVAVTARTVSHGWGPRAVHHVGAYGIRERLQELALSLVGGNAVRREVTTIEITCSALVQIEEIIVVDPLEVEHLRDGFAHARI